MQRIFFSMQIKLIGPLHAYPRYAIDGVTTEFQINHQEFNQNEPYVSEMEKKNFEEFDEIQNRIQLVFLYT